MACNRLLLQICSWLRMRTMMSSCMPVISVWEWTFKVKNMSVQLNGPLFETDLFRGENPTFAINMQINFWNWQNCQNYQSTFLKISKSHDKIVLLRHWKQSRNEHWHSGNYRARLVRRTHRNKSCNGVVKDFCTNICKCQISYLRGHRHGIAVPPRKYIRETPRITTI